MVGKTDKVFTFLSKDEVEKLKMEEERKIATLAREKKDKLITSAADVLLCEGDADDDDEDNLRGSGGGSDAESNSSDKHQSDEDIEEDDEDDMR